MKSYIPSSVLLFALTLPAFANSTPIKSTTAPAAGKFYVGVFGGGGSSNSFNVNQFGTAYFLELNGGPLAVNAFGNLNSKSVSFFGAQLGYQVQEIVLNSSSQWALEPAVELEGYAMNQNSFGGVLVNNTSRLPEHDFSVSYPISNTVFLANAVINFNNLRVPSVHPYVGFGIGSGLVRISDANATQVSPPEPGVNHYNASPSDTNTTFAGQIKLGLSYDITKCVSVFADYRWLYIANTHFTFGSTVYPLHAETSNWQVNMDAQKYNLGNIGIRLNF
jgi:opacity protein-like surface antigen